MHIDIILNRFNHDTPIRLFAFGGCRDARIITQSKMDDTSFIGGHGAKTYVLSLLACLCRS